MSPVNRLALFLRSCLTTLSFIKNLMCSYEKPGWPVTEISVFATKILVTRRKILIYELSKHSSQNGIIFVLYVQNYTSTLGVCKLASFI